MVNASSRDAGRLQESVFVIRVGNGYGEHADTMPHTAVHPVIDLEKPQAWIDFAGDAAHRRIQGQSALFGGLDLGKGELHHLVAGFVEDVDLELMASGMGQHQIEDEISHLAGIPGMQGFDDGQRLNLFPVLGDFIGKIGVADIGRLTISACCLHISGPEHGPE